MALLDNPKAAPFLGLLLAGLLGYLFYSGDVVKSIGIDGVPVKQERIVVGPGLDRLPRGPDRQREARPGPGHNRRSEEPDRIVPRDPGGTPPAGARTERGPEPARRHLDPGQDPGREPRRGGAPAGRVRAVAVRYLHLQLAVVGRYDQIGEFLADIASLRRIIVPYDVSLAIGAARPRPRRWATRPARCWRPSSRSGPM